MRAFELIKNISQVAKIFGITKRQYGYVVKKFPNQHQKILVQILDQQTLKF